MKILSVRLKNINSLKGEHFIAFNKSPFTESGLFAITGPTGAGKSSILDAITLALYGWAPRFNRDSPLEIMSYHTSDCLAEVEFEVKEKVYRSRWSLHRSRGKIDGEIQQPRMELIDVMADIILESKKTDVINRVTDITGLDYFRFLRSVMLAQGDFAAFLRADEKSRGELLEKITGTDIYTKISRRAFEKQKEKRQRLEQLESSLDVSRLLTADEKENYLLQVEQNRQKNKELGKYIEKLISQLQWLENIEALRIKSTQLQAELQVVDRQKQAFQPELERYANYQKTIPYQPLYREVEVAETKIQELEKEICQVTQDIPLLESQKDQVYASVQQAQHALAQAKQVQRENLPVMEKAADLDKELERSQLQFSKLTAEYKLMLEEKANFQQQVSHQQKQLNQYKDKQQGIKNYIGQHIQDGCLEAESNLIEQNLAALFESENELAVKQKDAQRSKKENQQLIHQQDLLEEAVKNYTRDLKFTEAQLHEIDQSILHLLNGEDIEQVEQQMQELTNTYAARINQLTFSKDYAEKNDKIIFMQKEIQENERTFSSRQNDYQALKEKEQQAHEHWLVLQKLCERENLILNYETARNKLVTGEECPLCGSLHHPFITQSHNIELSKTEQQRDAQKLIVEKIGKQIEIVDRQLVVLETNRITALKEINDYSIQITTLESQFESFNQQIGEQNHIAALDVMKRKLETGESAQHKLKTLLQEYQQKNKLRSQCKTQQEIQRQSLSEARNEWEKCKLRLENESKSLQNLLKEIAVLERKKHEQYIALQNLVVPYQLTIPEETKQAPWLSALRQRAALYQEYKKQDKELDTLIGQLHIEMAKIESALHNVAAQAEKQNTEIERLKKQGETLLEERVRLFGNKKIEAEKERLQAVVEQYELQLRNGEKALNDKNERLSIRKQQLSDKQLLLDAHQHGLTAQKGKLFSGLHTAGFIDLVHFKSCILDIQSEATIKKQKEAFEEKMNGLKGAIHQNEQAFKEQGARELTESGMAELAKILKTTQADKETLIAETGRTEQILSDNEKLVEKNHQLTEDIEKFRKEYERWKILSDMIGSATGAEFNIFAQGLTLSRLVQLANRFLEKLNPRYHIRRKPHTDLDLEIIDRYQADNIRTMKTLSGGETFLVSLALALGLSDLAGNKTRIDSLFIDEGFGTLDPQTLDIAITTLENLQATGKMIGIISHVEALKERITTQIQVTKQSGGVSTIEIFG